MDEPEDPTEPVDNTPELDIMVVVQDGEVTSVFYKGEQVRAQVIDFDVEFPAPAGAVKQNEDGAYYYDLIV